MERTVRRQQYTVARSHNCCRYQQVCTYGKMGGSASPRMNAALGMQVHSEEKGSGIAMHFADHIDASLTWDFLPWLHTVTSLPIFLKVCPLFGFLYRHTLMRSS